MKRAIPCLLALWLLAQPVAGASPAPPALAEPPVSAVPADPQPTPEASTAPSGGAARLYIDNQNVYEGMEKSYSQGYVPTIEDGHAILVLPLLCGADLEGHCLRVRLGLGEGGPFVPKNYEITVERAWNPVAYGQVEGYCVRVPLQLQAGRVNGSYPVQIEAIGREKSGAEVREAFTLYVTITDGVDPHATPAPTPTPEPPPEEPPVLAPKVLVQSYTVEPLEEGAPSGPINAGGRLRVRAVLVNTSQTEGVENMAVSAAAPTEYFLLDSPSNCLYIASIPAGGTAEVTLEYTSKAEAPAGQYEIALSYDYAYHQGQTATGSGSARVDIAQPLRMEFSLLQVPSEAVISDTVELKVQAINLSRAPAYNVRASLEADGLLPSGTAFVGDLEGGASGEAPLPATVTGLTGSAFPYGPTTGTVTYIYEDGAGMEHTETGSFALEVKSPFPESQPAGQDDPSQWWAVMGCTAGALLAFAGAFGIRALRRRHGG